MKIIGKVIRGEGRGRTLGFPTANIQIQTSEEITEGVFAAEVLLEQKNFEAILHCGVKKTFNQKFSVEVHLLDFSTDKYQAIPEFYDQIIEIILNKKIRQVQKFSSKENLVTQIESDETQARKIFLREKINTQWKIFLENTEQKKQTEKIIAGKTENSLEFQTAENIFAFAPTKQELDFVSILYAKFPTKKWFFPRIENKEICFYESQLETLIPGNFGILEPKTEAKNKTKISPNTLIIVPLLAVKKDGTRLGKGGGYYDRFLKQAYSNSHGNFKTLSALPKEFVLDFVPKNSFDVNVEKVVR